MLIAYENRKPMDEEEDTGPSMRRRTARPRPETDEANEEVVTESPDDEDDRPKLKRSTPGATPTAETGETKTVEPATVEPKKEPEMNPDRPRLKRRRGPPGGF